jgi:antirestriction protein ArdC
LAGNRRRQPIWLRSFTLPTTSRLLAILREDNRAIVRAASAASKAADFLLAFGRAEEEALDLARAA